MPRTLQICCSTLASPLAFSIPQWSLSISLVALVYSSPGGAAHFLVLAYQIPDVPISLSQNLRTLRATDSSSRSFDDHRHLVDWPVQLLLEDFATASDDLVDWRPKDFFMRTYANMNKMCVTDYYNMDKVHATTLQHGQRIDDKACDYYYAGMNMKYVTDYCIKY